MGAGIFRLLVRYQTLGSSHAALAPPAPKLLYPGLFM